MLDHVGLAVSDFAKSKSFFERALAPLGYKCLMEYPRAAGFGSDRPDFWIGGKQKFNFTHAAFSAVECRSNALDDLQRQIAKFGHSTIFRKFRRRSRVAT